MCVCVELHHRLVLLCNFLPFFFFKADSDSHTMKSTMQSTHTYMDRCQTQGEKLSHGTNQHLQQSLESTNAFKKEGTFISDGNEDPIWTFKKLP